MSAYYFLSPVFGLLVIASFFGEAAVRARSGRARRDRGRHRDRAAIVTGTYRDPRADDRRRRVGAADRPARRSACSAPFFIVEFAVTKAQLGAMFTALYLGIGVVSRRSRRADRSARRTRMVAITAALMTVALIVAALVAELHVARRVDGACSAQATPRRRRPAAARFSSGSIATAALRWVSGKPA